MKTKKSQQDISKTFSKLMMEGKIHSALRFLSEESQEGIHQLSEKILKDLRQQHPAPTEIQWNSLFDYIKQVWLADDASAAGNLDHLYAFFNCLQEEGK